MSPPSKILFINVSRIGDTLLSIPAIRAITQHYPQAQVDLLAHPKRMEVLENLPGIASVGAITKTRAPWLGHLGGKRYDVAFVCNYDKALVRYALRVAHHVIAYRQDDEALNQRLYRAVEAGPNTEHATQRALHLTAAYGIPTAERALTYRLSAQEKTWASSFLNERKLSDTHPLIGLQVASFPTKAYRDWPLENFISLCERIRQNYGNAHFLIFGGSLEQAKTEQLAQALGATATLCAGQLSLRQTAALMDRIDLYVGVDTGPTHLMGALHRPMVALYHSMSPSTVYGPLDHPCARIIDHPRTGPSAEHASMAEISVEQVWNAVQAQLEPT